MSSNVMMFPTTQLLLRCSSSILPLLTFPKSNSLFFSPPSNSVAFNFNSVSFPANFLSPRRSLRLTSSMAAPSSSSPQSVNAADDDFDVLQRIQSHQEKAARLPPVEQIRTVLANSTRATLSTFSKKYDGYPSGSMVDFACDVDGSPILAVSSLAVHTQDSDLEGHGQVGVERVDWCARDSGRVKLNTNATFVAGIKTARGGVVRSENGTWIKGFSVKFEAQNAQEAEIITMRFGFEFMKALDIAHFDLEIDAKNILDTLNS